MPKRNLVTFLGLGLLLASMSGIRLEIPIVMASSTIYIRLDGSIEGTDRIQRDGNLYTIIDNINDSIVVERSNIIIDGNGYTLQGGRSRDGFFICEISNVTIKNTNIRGFNHGIHQHKAYNNVISGNNISSNRYGIYLWWCSNNAFFGNSFSGNEMSLHVEGDMMPHFMHSIDASNFVDDKPVYYLENQEGLSINPSTYPEIGYLALINSTDITFENLTLRDNGQGLMLVNTNNSRITGNNMINNDYGAFLFSSFNNTLSENNIKSNYIGIFLKSSRDNTFGNNNFTGNICDILTLPAPIHDEPDFPNEPHDANAMWIEPSIIDLTDFSIGDRFNVTVWVNVTAASTAWQFDMLYDNSILNATNAGYTAGEKSDFFRNMTTWPFSPSFSIFNATHNRVTHGEPLFPASLMGPRDAGYGSLSWVEFEVVSKLSQTQNMITMIDISSLCHFPDSHTYVLSSGNEIPLNASDCICILNSEMILLKLIALKEAYNTLINQNNDLAHRIDILNNELTATRNIMYPLSAAAAILIVPVIYIKKKSKMRED